MKTKELLVKTGATLQMDNNKDQNFDNARDVRKYFEEANINMVRRIQHDKIAGDNRRVMLKEDLMKS